MRASPAALLATLLFTAPILIAGCGDDDDRTRVDAGTFDGGGELDAGPRPDTGTPVDAGSRVDAGDVCGDGDRGFTEECDDGNIDPGDGCSPGCAVEEGWRCLPGGACRRIVCGDSRIEAPERCDDGNATAGDGCSATCQLEEGWACTIPGVACQAAACGDGVVAGFEQCDDGGTAEGDGCDPECRLEPGWHCPSAGPGGCAPTVCGDGMTQGSEQCDDGNVRAYDGCDPECRNEPACSGGTCTATCGDGVILPGSSEECDDGNRLAGDGCSSTCEEEDGFECTLVPLPLPDSLRLPVVYRDMRGHFSTGDNLQAGSPIHPDFNARGGDGITFHMVSPMLDGEKRPAFSGMVIGGSGALSAESFHDWYRDSDRNTPVLDFLTLDRVGATDSYQFASDAFFPIDNRGFDVPGTPTDEHYDTDHNYSFTTEIRYWFQYQGNERLQFRGDDDVWVFVDGHLCLDVGGLHSPVEAIMNFANPDEDSNATQRAIVRACRDRLRVGGVYEVIVFHAERRCCGSSFRLTLSGFQTRESSCDWMCGDGVVTRFELCDDGPGMNTGEYGRCGSDCRSRGPFCGDGTLEPEVEACDDGIDDNDGRYGGCNPDCTLGPRCGDGVRQGTEECDAGEMNGAAASACDATCRLTLL